MGKARILLAFANELDKKEGFLKELKKEMSSLVSLWTRKDWEVHSLPNVTAQGISRAANIFQKEIRIFHYSGHASKKGVYISNEAGEIEERFATGLAGILGVHQGLKLAFLSGCWTGAQVEDFFKQGIPLVIASEYPIYEDIARLFAEYFYASLQENNTVQQAFDMAKYEVLALKGELDRVIDQQGEPTLLKGRKSRREQSPDFPFTLHIRPGFEQCAGDRLNDWALPPSSPGTPGNWIDESKIDLVDRIEQSEPFSEHFKGFPGLNVFLKKKGENDKAPISEQAFLDGPALYMMHGPAEEAPESLKRRLVNFGIKEILEDRTHLIFQEGVKIWTVKLPTQFALDHRDPNKAEKQLRENLSREIRGITADDISARDLALAIGQNCKVAVIRHEIKAEHWHKRMPELLERYFTEFWQVKDLPTYPRIVILFSLSLSQGNTFWGRLFGSGDAGVSKQFLALGKRLQASIPPESFLLLKDLEPVQQADVDEWRGIYLDHEYGLAEEIFERNADKVISRRGKKLLPMRVILQELHRAIEKHNDELKQGGNG